MGEVGHVYRPVGGTACDMAQGGAFGKGDGAE
jgi:hypothetical protein